MAVDKSETWIECGSSGFHWPYCVVDGCENRRCVNISDRFCFTHSPGNSHVKWMKIEAMRGTPLDQLEPF